MYLIRQESLILSNLLSFPTNPITTNQHRIMNKEDLVSLTDEELLLEAKKSKTAKIYDAVIIGMLIGIATYSTVINGFGLLTFLPLIYLPIAAKKKIRNNELTKLLKERNLNY